MGRGRVGAWLIAGRRQGSKEDDNLSAMNKFHRRSSTRAALSLYLFPFAFQTPPLPSISSSSKIIACKRLSRNVFASGVRIVLNMFRVPMQFSLYYESMLRYSKSSPSFN